MADEVQVIEQPQNASSNHGISPELDAQMKMALGNFVKGDWIDIKPTATTEPAATNPVQPLPNTQSAEPIITPAPISSPSPFDVIREKFNYVTPEDAIKEIEELRTLKANPKVAIEYENEDSKRLHEAIVAGKRDEVLSILNKQATIERLTSLEVNKDNAADIVKMGMQLKHPDLTQAEIDYKFNKQFAIPPQPREDDYSEDDYKTEMQRWQDIANDKIMDLQIEAKLAKPDISNAKSKLELPKIEADVDENYSKYLQEMEEVERLNAETQAVYPTIKAEALEIKLDFNDEANKIQFPFKYAPDEESYKEALNLVLDNEKFWKTFQNSDGSPNRQKWLQFVYNGLNANKIALEGIKQGSNARFKAQLPDNSNSQNRYMPQDAVQLNELDKQMQNAGVLRRTG